MLMPEDVEPIGVMVGDLGPVELQVAVTPAHIEMGTRRDCVRCPIALAVIDAARAMGLALHPSDPVGVCSDWVTVLRQDGRRFGGELPPAGQGFVLRFDESDPYTPGPFSFQLLLAAL